MSDLLYCLVARFQDENCPPRHDDMTLAKDDDMTPGPAASSSKNFASVASSSGAKMPRKTSVGEKAEKVSSSLCFDLVLECSNKTLPPSLLKVPEPPETYEVGSVELALRARERRYLPLIHVNQPAQVSHTGASCAASASTPSASAGPSEANYYFPVLRPTQGLAKSKKAQEDEAPERVTTITGQKFRDVRLVLVDDETANQKLVRGSLYRFFPLPILRFCCRQYCVQHSPQTDEKCV